MPHVCTSFWGRPAIRLTRALSRRTYREWGKWRKLQRRKWPKKGPRKVHPNDPFEGWVHRASREADYDALARLYGELLLAVKQPSDAPNKWRASAYSTGLKAVPSRAMGDLARAVLRGLERDGRARWRGRIVHRERGVARYGTPNWLEKPFEKVKKAKGMARKSQNAQLRTARELLRALRDAFGR